MNNNRQVFIGFLTALLSAAVIMGSLSLSLSESGLKLAMQITSTRTRGPRLSTITRTMKATTVILGEPSVIPIFTTPITFTPTPMFTFTLVPPPASCPPPVGWSPILVQTGDTLDNLAQQYNATTDELILANCLFTEELIPGTILYVPGFPSTETPIHCGPPSGWILYTVQPGDTLFYISLAFGVSISELQYANCLGSSTLIRTGQRIYVPNVKPRMSTASPTRRIPTKPQPSYTPSDVPSLTPTTQASATLTPAFTYTRVPSTNTPTIKPTSTNTPETPSPQPTNTQTQTSTATYTPSETPTSTGTPTPSETPTPSQTLTPEPIPTDTDSPTPTLTNTPLILPNPHTLTETP